MRMHGRSCGSRDGCSRAECSAPSLSGAGGLQARDWKGGQLRLGAAAPAAPAPRRAAALLLRCFPALAESPAHLFRAAAVLRFLFSAQAEEPVAAQALPAARLGVNPQGGWRMCCCPLGLRIRKEGCPLQPMRIASSLLPPPTTLLGIIKQPARGNADRNLLVVGAAFRKHYPALRKLHRGIVQVHGQCLIFAQVKVPVVPYHHPPAVLL